MSRRPPPPSPPSHVRPSSSSPSASATRSCRRASCATARSSSPGASRSTSPATSPPGIPRVRFVYVNRLAAPRRTVRPWDLTIASIRPRQRRTFTADLSDPYLGTDQAVVLRRGLPRLSTLADLRRKITCAMRASDGARAIAGSVRPRLKPILAPSDARLLELVQTGACDAALVDARPSDSSSPVTAGILGPVSAKVERGSGYVVAVTKGGPSPSPRSTAPLRGCVATAPCTGSPGNGSGSILPGCGPCADARGLM